MFQGQAISHYLPETTPDYPGGITNKGWTFNSEQNYYLIDIKSYNININNGGSYNNPTTIHEEIVSKIWTIRDNKINQILE
jgi:hypothetical protein